MTEFGLEETQTPVWLQVYLLLLIGSGISCLIILFHRLRTSTLRQSTARLSEWSVRWTDFGLIFWLMFFPVFILQLLLSQFFGPPEAEDSEGQTWRIVVAGLAMQLGLISVYGYIRRTQPQLFLEKINCRPLPLTRAAPTALFVFLASFPAVALTSYYWQILLTFLQNSGIDFTTQPQNVVVSMRNAQSPLTMILMALLAVVGAPIVEELIFRGSLYRFLKFRIRRAAAALISAGAFATIHFNLTSFFPLIVLGIFLCLSYEISGNLKVPILMHAIFNLNSVILIFSLP